MAHKKHHPLKVVRVALALCFFLLLTAMFLDFTGTLHHYLSWMAKVQLLPAILSVNVAVVVGLLLLTFIVGRVYCSVICPLGVMQDCFTFLSGKTRKRRFRPTKAHNILRYTVMVVFAVLIVAGLQSVALLIAPYSAYGRIVNSMFAPLVALINNGLAAMAERADSYAFYSTDVWLKSAVSLTVAVLTFVGLGILAARRGRLWCNTICPVGSLLSLCSRYSLLAPVIDKDKCTRCKACERGCKSECIDIAEGSVDTSRCVACMDCLQNCKFNAMHYTLRHREQTAPAATGSAAETAKSEKQANGTPDNSRRQFLATTAALTVTALAQAQHKTTDGGLAAITSKRVPTRAIALKPAGARSLKHFSAHCTACGLCVSACPNQVLRPSNGLLTLMQPEMSFERGYCPENCTRCSEVCPTGAIEKITAEERLDTQIGHAVWIKENCVVISDGVACGNCAKHCPTNAILMVETPEGTVPAVDETLCIGCGKCEYVCPARPFSAIYVEGYEKHRQP